VDSLQAFLSAEGGAVGYLVVDLQGPSALLQEILRAGMPVVLIAESLGGGGITCFTTLGETLSVIPWSE